MNEEDMILHNQILKYREGIIKRLYWAVDSLFLDSPIEDFTEEEKGYERGLSAALTMIRNHMKNKKFPNVDMDTIKKEVDNG